MAKPHPVPSGQNPELRAEACSNSCSAPSSPSFPTTCTVVMSKANGSARRSRCISVWFELRWGITACLMLTVTLITVIFYYHPTTTNVTAFYRTVPIAPEANGRVAEVLVGWSGEVRARRADLPVGQSRPAGCRRYCRTPNRRNRCGDGGRAGRHRSPPTVKSSRRKAPLQQALDELETKQELNRRNAEIVARREIERLENFAEGQRGALAAATAGKKAAEEKLTSLCPRKRPAPRPPLAQAQVELNKRDPRRLQRPRGAIRTTGWRHRQPDDAAGRHLHPGGRGSRQLQRGFGQIEAQVMRPA